MNKKVINRQLPYAYDALSKVKVVDANGVIKKTFRGQIATFGAAVTSGSLPAAIAFFSDNGEATVERSRLMEAIWYVLQTDSEIKTGAYENLFRYALGCETAKDDILNATIALKLAMNLYELAK